MGGDSVRYDIPSLETNEALKFAKELNEIIVDGDFVFNANMSWVRPFGMLLAACSVKQFRNMYPDIPFRIECHTPSEGISYASHMGFFKSISEKLNIGKEPGEATGNDNYIPITELDFGQIYKEKRTNGMEIGDAIEMKASELAKVLSRDNKEIHILLTYLLLEILRNIPEHAECNKAWLCGQFWSDGIAEIAIVDEGIGILSSLQRNFIHKKYIKNDKDAITSAIKAGISQAYQSSRINTSMNPWANSGFGLYMVSEICKELHGSFCLASGNKFIITNSDGTTNIGDTFFKGTAIKMTISTKSLKNSKDIIKMISSQGEVQAKTIRNAFKKASISSRGFLDII